MTGTRQGGPAGTPAPAGVRREHLAAVGGAAHPATGQLREAVGRSLADIALALGQVARQVEPATARREIERLHDALRAAADELGVAEPAPFTPMTAVGIVAGGAPATAPRLVGTAAYGIGAVTRREEEVLQLIADGCSTPQVAQRLYISQKTVKNHLASIYRKLDVGDRTQAVLLAVRHGLVRLREP